MVVRDSGLAGRAALRPGLFQRASHDACVRQCFETLTDAVFELVALLLSVTVSLTV